MAAAAGIAMRLLSAAAAAPRQVHKSLQRIRERKTANFIEWGPASIQVRRAAAFGHLRGRGAARIRYFDPLAEHSAGHHQTTPTTTNASNQGGAVEEVALRPDGAPRERPHAGQPHVHPPPVQQDYAGLREAHRAAVGWQQGLEVGHGKP